MTYRVLGLDPAPFRHLYGLDDQALAAHHARRYLVDRTPGFPDRVELRDLEPGETALLLNFVHQPGNSPYRASHAIFVREGAEQAAQTVGVLPQVMRHRPLSLRAFDAAHMMVDATLVTGADAEGPLVAMLEDARVQYIQAHYAARGCYAARIERA